MSGNATKLFDSGRVQQFIARFPHISALYGHARAIDDIFEGSVRAQSEGHTATRPLSKRMLFRVLARCPTIGTQAVDWAIGGGYSRAQVYRYAAAGRVASRAIASLLDKQPEIETSAEAIGAWEGLDFLDHERMQ